MFKAGDLVKYKNDLSPSIFGIITDVLTVKSSVSGNKVSDELYKVQPMDSRFSWDVIKKDQVLAAYSKYYSFKSKEEE